MSEQEQWTAEQHINHVASLAMGFGATGRADLKESYGKARADAIEALTTRAEAEAREGALLRDCEVYKGHAEEQLGRAVKAELERDQARRHALEWEAKLTGETCACSYDNPGEICMHHSPMLASAEARLKAMEEALRMADYFPRPWLARQMGSHECRPLLPHSGAVRMSRTAAKVTQADVARALRAVEQTGYPGVVEITRDGTIRIVPNTLARTSEPPPLDDDEPIDL